MSFLPFASPTPAVAATTPRSIAGNDVPYGKRVLATVSYADALRTVLNDRPVEAYSRDTKRLIAPHEGGSAHGFIAAAQAAYAGHYPLVLSPDIIWLLIAQGFALHVRQNAESLRHRFVAHEGQVDIVVKRMDFLRGFEGNDWEGIFAEFSEAISQHIGPTAHSAIVPTFSTTGIVEKAAFEITLMDAMQRYFRYRVEIVCGIPLFVLEGTTKDWTDLRAHAMSLLDYDLSWWKPHLLPLLDEFVAASCGQAERTFWTNFYKEQREGCGDPAISGHLLKLFPYLPSLDENAIRVRHDENYSRREAIQIRLSTIFDPDEYTRQLEWAMREVAMHEMVKIPATVFEPNPVVFCPPDENPGYDRLSPNSFPSALSRAPFTLKDYRTSAPMEFIAGFVGAAQDETTLAIRPEIGWAVCPRQ